MSSFRKLISQRGTVLGTVTYPDRWEDYLSRDREVRFHAPLDFTPYAAGGAAPLSPDVLAVGMLALAYHPEHPGAVQLYGMSIEQFERLPRCYFAPSAAYMRSLIEVTEED